MPTTAPIPEPAKNPSPKTFSVGTLTYTKRTLAAVFFWMIWGDVVFVLVERVFPASMPLQLNRLHIDTLYVTMMMTTLSQFIHIPMNPFLSVSSDRTRTRFGRRIPFLFFTLIPLSLCMAALGFSDEIGAYVRSAGWVQHIGLAPVVMIILLMSVLIILFDFFNAFMQTVYYYLAADVIPREVFGRYTSTIRVASLSAGSFFSFFIQRYIEIRTEYIYCGGAVLCVLGFGLMCWKVREGQYPPPKELDPDDHWYMRIVRPIQLMVTECFRHPIFIAFFVSNTMIRFSEAAGLVGYIYYYRKYLHLPQADLGNFQGFYAWLGIILVVPMGWLVDKIHPMRATLIAMACIIPLNFFGFYMESYTLYMLWFLIRSPFLQLTSAAGPPLEVTLYPRKQYGQFASANGTVRSLFMLFGSIAGGWFISFFERRMGNAGDRFAFLWLSVLQAVAFGCMFVTYLYWKAHGAEKFVYDPDRPLIQAVALKESDTLTAGTDLQDQEAQGEEVFIEAQLKYEPKKNSD